MLQGGPFATIRLSGLHDALLLAAAEGQPADYFGVVLYGIPTTAVDQHTGLLAGNPVGSAGKIVALRLPTGVPGN